MAVSHGYVTLPNIPPCCWCARATPPPPPLRSLAVTWDDDDVLGLLDQLHSLLHVDLGVGARDLHGLASASGGGSVAAKDDVSQ